MQTHSVEVKSGGKIISTIDVEKFENIDEAVDFLGDGNREAGSEAVLSLVNSQHRANRMNAERVSKTQGTSAFKALREKVKENPEAKAELAALLSKLGIEGELKV